MRSSDLVLKAVQNILAVLQDITTDILQTVKYTTLTSYGNDQEAAKEGRKQAYVGGIIGANDARAVLSDGKMHNAAVGVLSEHIRDTAQTVYLGGFAGKQFRKNSERNPGKWKNRQHYNKIRCSKHWQTVCGWNCRKR